MEILWMILLIFALFRLIEAIADLARFNNNKKLGRYTDGMIFNSKTGRLEGDGRPKDD
jgi:hypothetical protein